MTSSIEKYFGELNRLGSNATVQDHDGLQVALDDAIDWTIAMARQVTKAGGKLMFIGNGGSAGIASHMAIDYSKNGGLRALAFNDGAALTCLSNDLGYENVFSTQIDMHGHDGDLLMAISSSGQSPSILNAVETARAKNIAVATFSGFTSENPLRRSGDMNFFIDSDSYGFVEISHLSLIHAVLDRACEQRPKST